MGYTYGISVQCTPQNPLGQAVAVAGLGAENTYLWCAGKTGSHTGYASATDSANKVSNQATAAVNVLAPDKLVVLDGDKTVSFVGASATATHTFVLRRGNEDVGGCLVASASERGWDPSTQEPTTWEYTGMSPATSPQFYFQSPLIHDVRYYVKGQKFSSTANGDVVETFKQRVKVDVPKCPNGTTAVESAVLTYEIIRVSATKVRFVVK